MNSKLFGGTLLVIGTTIGAGMLALPVSTSQVGFWGSTMLLIACWAIMTSSAFLSMEVNLWLPKDSNLISMAGATLGRVGQAVAWVLYLGLLYSIISAYVAGGGDLFHYIFNLSGLPISRAFSSIIFTFILGSVVYLGVRSVDYVNRGLMFGKLGALFLSIVLLTPHVSFNYLAQGSLSKLASPTTIAIVILSFTSSMIIPTLRTYFNDDRVMLKKAIFYGMLIPLLCYIAWNFVIMGVVPLAGQIGLTAMMHSNSSNSDLLNSLSVILNNHTLDVVVNFFESICMATSFLSISLCLVDFLSDGLSIPKKGAFNTIVLHALTFAPPVSIVLFYPGAFIKGLSYAGLICFVLIVAYPPLMVWRGRYHHDLPIDTSYRVKGGKMLLVVILVFATLMLAFGIENTF